MTDAQPNNPLHGITLKALLTELVQTHGWEYLADRVRVNCFANEPSLTSSLKFLRKTPWARDKVEQLYLSDLRQKERKRKRNLRRAARRAYAASVADGTAEPTVDAESRPVEVSNPSESTDAPASGWSFASSD